MGDFLLAVFLWFLKITRRRKYQLSRRVIRSRPREQFNKRVSKETLRLHQMAQIQTFDVILLKITRRRKFQLSRRVIRSRPREQSNKRVSKETLS